MATTIFEMLQCANKNLNNGSSVGLIIAKDQVSNVVELLGNGHSLDEDFYEAAGIDPNQYRLTQSKTIRDNIPNT